MRLETATHTGFRDFCIAYKWVCFKCEAIHVEAMRGRPGDHIWLPSVPSGWTLVTDPEAVPGYEPYIRTYCPAHKVTSTLTVKDVVPFPCNSLNCSLYSSVPHDRVQGVCPPIGFGTFPIRKEGK